MINIKSDRDNTIDVVKGIGIILVVFAHIIDINPFSTIVYSFHMPLFFCVSGLLFNPNKYSSFSGFIIKKLKDLMLPYLFFCILGFLWGLVYCVKLPINEILEYIREVFVSIVWARYSGKYFIVFNTPMWFVPCLLTIMVMFYFLSKIKNKPLLFIVSVIVIPTIGWFMESQYCKIDFSILPFNFSSACFSLSFFSIGYFVSDFYKIKISKMQINKKLGIIGGIILLVVALATVVLSLINGHVSIGSRHLNNGFIFIVTGLLGTLCVFYVARVINKSKFLIFCGQNSFIIMGIHIVLYRMILFVFSLIGKYLNVPMLIYNEKENALLGVILSLLVVLLSCLFTIIYNKAKAKICYVHKRVNNRK